jgi:hypothetical protein
MTHTKESRHSHEQTMADLRQRFTALKAEVNERFAEWIPILTLEAIEEGLSSLGLHICSSNGFNIKRKGSDAWSGGRLGVTATTPDKSIWLSTFPLGKIDIDENRQRSDGGSVEFKKRVEELTSGWIVGKEGIKGNTKYFPSRSLNITHTSVDNFIHIIKQFQ